MPNIKNTGINIEKEILEQSSEDYVFGSGKAKKLSGLAEGIDLRKYLPAGELQFGKEDFMDCATRSPNNIIETKLNYAIKHGLISPETIEWLAQNGYYSPKTGVELSDRFPAILSGTTKEGNSLKAPLQAIHELGSIPKKMLPANKNMTWAEYHDPKSITKEMKDLAKEFKKRILVNYVRVYSQDFTKVNDMVGVAGYAWENPVNGIYPNARRDFNHAFAIFPPVVYEAFDNYHDKTDGDFIKRLSPDYLFYDYGYRVIVNETKVVVGLIEKLISTILILIGIIEKKEMTNSEKIVKICLEKEGTDFTPDHVVPNEFSCAFAVSMILKEIIPSMPILVATKDLYRFMEERTDLFRKIKQPISVMKPGYIVISPTTYNTRPDVMPNGHVGFYVTDTVIMSNSSDNGLWVKNFTRDSWRNRYYYKGGYPIEIFELI